MSRYFSDKYSSLTPYVPGEQPKDMRYVKLNTNESPFPPSAKALERAAEAAKRLMLYSDPECTELTCVASQRLGVEMDEILFTNGSDEALNFAFMAFCDDQHPAVFPDITYGFYSVFAQLNRVPYRQIPLQDDFSIRVDDYMGVHGTVFIANPNAPTGLMMNLDSIEQILQGNPDNVVVIDEAYVDFGGVSALPLIHKYDNLLVVQTFSKSRSMAGARLGFAAGCKELIRDLKTIQYATNPYNVNSMTMAAGIGALEDDDYFRYNCRTVIENREWTRAVLQENKFTVLDSASNFLFAKHNTVPGEELYRSLKEKGVLVRHFAKPRLSDYIRVTVGSKEQMEVFLEKVKEILEENP